uniref:Pept_C1 domain-containing protein n=1 Tax=Haemonchus contortus TaxID=6289 RepID=A0A7I4XTW1_HAECO|nr:Peptidase C1A domain containing protein [Haemonchus contortus]
MPEKDRRVLNTEQKRSRRNRRLLMVAVVLSLLGVVILVMAGFLYIRSAAAEEEWKRNSDEYLRKLVNQVNDNPNLLWKAKYNRFGVKNRSYGFEYTRNATAVQEVLNQLQAFFDSDAMKQHIQELVDFPDSSLPTHFDARLKWPQCPSISRIPNQGGCGSCYAVAAAGVASDRACIKSNGTFRASLSEEDILGCCAVCGNCYGGDPLKALVYWVNEGVVTGGRDGCRPYSFDLSCGVPCSPATFFGAEKNRICIRRCQDIYYQNNYENDKHYASLAYSMYPRTMTVSSDGSLRAQVPTIIGHLNKTSDTPMTLTQIRNIIKKEISLFGPTTMAFPVSEEFLHYSSGIFQPYPLEDFDKRIVYWHVVRLIGWGQAEDGSHYWTAINSFGEHWGDSGVFKINADWMEKYGLEYETALV